MSKTININYQSYKRKVFNDPIYGFITIPSELIFYLIEHPYFQRLRRICQLGTSHFVYPGALHTRFHHALGAMHLMNTAIDVIRNKGCVVTELEKQSALVAILLHDIGHGPFSHTLEHDLLQDIQHENISAFFMQRIECELKSEETKNIIRIAQQIFAKTYKKTFLCQLVSSQLDVDRLDYLNRDSFYTGVSDGVIGSSRIIEMLNVYDNQLVLEEKGIYSLERFITARQLMYWQVYLHKTVVSADLLLTNIIRRARHLLHDSHDSILKCVSEPLSYFLQNKVISEDFVKTPELIDRFSCLDDYDIMSAIKFWQFSDDKILSDLSRRLLHRKLFKIKIARQPFSLKDIENKKYEVAQNMKLSLEDTRYFVHSASLSNSAYRSDEQNILVLLKNGTIGDISDLFDNFTLSTSLSNPVERFFFCYPQ